MVSPRLKYPVVAGMGTQKEYVATNTMAENTAIRAIASAPFEYLELEVMLSLWWGSS